MIAALAITLREGMEAALVLGIILAYLRRTGRSDLKRYAYWGLGLAVVVSLATGAALEMAGLNVDDPLVEGVLLAVGGVFVASMVLWMWRTAKNIRGQMEARMDNIVAGKRDTRAAVAFFAFTFFMVAREGVEMMLFLAAATLGQTNFMSVAGGVLGIALAVLFAMAFIQGSLKINLPRFFSVTTIVLLVLAARLLAGSIHEFAEKGFIPNGRSVMNTLTPFTEGKVSSVLLIGLILVPMLVVLWDFRNAGRLPACSESGADCKKQIAARRWENVWRFGLLAATVIIVLAMARQVFAATLH